ncbi:unnamed protein product [Sympodiomycopsis kandeliae]
MTSTSTELSGVNQMLSRSVQVRIPGIAMLELASTIVHDLDQHLVRKQQENETREEEEDAIECLELRFDLSITQKAIDPQRWAEDKAIHGRPITAADFGSTQQRLSALFNLDNIPKARYVIADAIALHDSNHSERQTGEQGMLELIKMISEGRLPPAFFQLQTVESVH